jgi:hypothetical protein
MTSCPIGPEKNESASKKASEDMPVTDSVHISKSKRRSTKKISPEPVSDLAPEEKQPAPAGIDPSLRNARIEDIKGIKQQFENGELKGEAFTAAAYKLSEYLQEGSDPLIKRMAGYLLKDYVDFGTPEINWMLKIGLVKGPVRYLTSMCRHVEDDRSRQYLGDSARFPEFLKALAQGTAGRPVPENAIKIVTRLSNSFLRRAEAQLDPETRAKEPADKDMHWAAGCASLVDFWWKNGQIEVRRSGEVLKPGSLDIKELVAGGSVSIRGSAIELEGPEKKHSLKERRKAAEILKEIDPYGKDKKDKGLTMLEDLCRNDSPLAAKVVDVIVDDLYRSIGGNERLYGGVRGVSRILARAADNDSLKELLRPHLGTLRDVPPRANSYSSLDSNNLVGGDYLEFTMSLIKSFPEVLDARFVKESLGPMLFSDEINTGMAAAKIAKELWKEHPDLISPTLETMLKEGDQPCFDDDQWSLINEAAESYHWVPEKPLMDALVTRMYYPPGRQKESLFYGSGLKGGDLGGAIKFLTIFAAKDPSLLDGYEIPDTGGNMVRADRAMLDRVLNDPGSEVERYLYTKGTSNNDYHGRIKDFYTLITADGVLIDEMLGKLKEGFARAGSVGKMSLAEQRMLAIIGSLDLGEARAAKLKETLMAATEQNQGFYVFTEIVDRIRNEELQKGKDELSKGSLTPDAHFTRARQLLSIAHCTGYSGDAARRSEPILMAMDEGMKAGSMDRPAMTSALFKEFQASLAKHGTLGVMPLRDLALFQVLDHLSRDDDGLTRCLWDSLKPGLTLDQGYGNGIIMPMVDRFRNLEMDKNRAILSHQSLTPGERTEMVEKNEALAKSSYNFKADEMHTKTLSAFCEGLKETCPSYPIGSMPGFFVEPENALKAYTGLIQHAKNDRESSSEWVKLKDILDSTGGEKQLDLAMDTYHYIEEMAQKGMDRDKALAHALRSNALGANPRSVPMEDERAGKAAQNIEIEEDFVDIGGLKLNVAKEKP